MLISRFGLPRDDVAYAAVPIAECYSPVMLNERSNIIAAMPRARRLLFFAFFVSGFCGLLYQVVWLRLALAAFGVITPVLSTVLSLYMLGLGIGSQLPGLTVLKTPPRNWQPLLTYAAVEAAIGLWSLLVPHLFSATSGALLGSAERSSLDYFFRSAAAIGVSILPGCILMGTTFPLASAFIRDLDEREPGAFSFLYVANVLGATFGVALTALFIIELVGFRATLTIGALANIAVAALCASLSRRWRPADRDRVTSAPRARWPRPGIFMILFYTGFFSMASEVAWTRAFTPIVQTTIYAFAFLLTVYLAATMAGSMLYRRHLKRGAVITIERLLFIVAITSFLPLALTDPRLHPGYWHLVAGVFPLCAAIGYLTPKLVDDFALGDAAAIGRAYALNVAGCVIGPLAAGYLLIPVSGVKGGLVWLAAPLALLAVWRATPRWRPAVAAAMIAGAALTVTVLQSYEDGGGIPGRFELRRDETATVISTGAGMEKRLIVNGIGLTHLTPITKVMAHLPLLMHRDPPKSMLVICFGMGTTFRSSLSWGVETTAVELVPSVRDAFPYYYADAAAMLADPKGRIVIDDGRRFLRRTNQLFDVVTLDPPPPIEAAASSLLYSREFYQAVSDRLRDDGILQQWFPGGERTVFVATLKAITATFPYVRLFHSREGWGIHMLASRQPIAIRPVPELMRRIPPRARQDLMEWFPGGDVAEILGTLTGPEMALDDWITRDALGPLTDDRPYNEYFLVRRQLGRTTELH
jgi:spermidine synthase